MTKGGKEGSPEYGKEVLSADFSDFTDYAEGERVSRRGAEARRGVGGKKGEDSRGGAEARRGADSAVRKGEVVSADFSDFTDYCLGEGEPFFYLDASACRRGVT